MVPYINVVFTLSLIGSLSNFGLVAATTGGGPGNATMIPSMLMYQVAFGDSEFGYASSMGVIPVSYTHLDVYKRQAEFSDNKPGKSSSGEQAVNITYAVWRTL